MYTTASKRLNCGWKPTHAISSYAVSARMLSTGLKGLFFRLPKKFGLARSRALKLPRACSGWSLFIEIVSVRGAGLRVDFLGSFTANLLTLDCPQTVCARQETGALR